MKFDRCGTCLKHIRNREIDQHMCMYCDGSNYYESIMAKIDKPAEPKMVYITTGGMTFAREWDRQVKEAIERVERLKTDSKEIEVMFKNNSYIKTHCFRHSMPQIKDVIFNPPATIVFWSDNTKTVVKCQEDDIYDPEKGLAMAISKKVLGNKRDYYHTFKHWLKKCPYVESLCPKITLKVDPFSEEEGK